MASKRDMELGKIGRRLAARPVRVAVVGVAAVAVAVVAVVGAPGDGDDVIRAPTDADAVVVNVHARVSGTLGPPPATIDVAHDGRAVVLIAGRPEDTPEPYEIRLTDGERTELRDAIVASGFFDDEWGPERMATDIPSWDVTLVLGDRERRRTVRGQPEFEPVTRFLWRILEQALIARQLREGRWQDVRSARLIRPSALVPEICECTVRAEKEWTAGEAAGALMDLVTPENWTAATVPLLARLTGTRRDTVLAAWAYGSSSAGHEGVRHAFAPTALAEVEARRNSWTDLPRARQDTLHALLAVALAAHEPGALRMAGETVRAFSTPGSVFVPRGLPEAGPDGVALVVTLLSDENVDAREAAARASHALIDAVREPARNHARLDDDAREALGAAVDASLIPALRERSTADDEALETRHICFDAIARWEGRDLAAERRAAREKERAERATADAERAAADEARRVAEPRPPPPPPPPRGDLEISGHVFGQAESPLADFTVLAMRHDGPPTYPWREYAHATTDAEGAFVIAGIVEGAFRLVALQGRRWGPRAFANNGSMRDDVRAGATGVTLRFPGAMLRGRVVYESGRPVARQAVTARMRDAPSVLTEPCLVGSGWGQTDADGRFVMLQLLPGTYDVTVPGHPCVAGASDLAARPGEHVITLLPGAALAGRVLDECGEPLPLATVGATAEGSSDEALRATSGRDGRFRIEGLDPALRYRVVASIAAHRPAATSHVTVADVAPGTDDLVLRIDTGPRIDFTVEFGARRASDGGSVVRIVRIGDGEPHEREFRTSRVLWRLAPEGEWAVSARVRDLDDHGALVTTWIDLGTLRTGEPPRTFAIPR